MIERAHNSCGRRVFLKRRGCQLCGIDKQVDMAGGPIFEVVQAACGAGGRRAGHPFRSLWGEGKGGIEGGVAEA